MPVSRRAPYGIQYLLLAELPPPHTGSFIHVELPRQIFVYMYHFPWPSTWTAFVPSLCHFFTLGPPGGLPDVLS